MLWLYECLYCGNFVYHLGDGRIKCSVCNKKLSKERINKIITIIEAFSNNETALHLSKRINISYVSVQKYYENLRYLCAKISEQDYENIRLKECEYEEYFYMQKSKKQKKEYIFDAHNFLTFDYDGYIYTLLMPSLKQYKKQFLQDSVEDVYVNEFLKFKRESKIIKVNKRFNNIVKFWDYFEKSILPYKGIKDESFIFFLKEFEFKYNYSKDNVSKLLIKKYFEEK